MRFANPETLWAMAVLLPALAFFLIWAWRRKQRLVSQFVQSRLLATLTVGVSHARQKLRLVLLFFAATFALLALARPQWGFDWQEAQQQGLDIIVAIDTSKSMLAADISPDRLTRAKLAAFDLMKLAKTDRLGLVAFAGTAFLQCPLTLDEEAFRQSVEALDSAIIPQGGTAVTEAIDAATVAFEKSENHKVLVLFTDGEDQDSGAVATAEEAAKSGLRIFTIGVGTREGELLRVRDEQGNLVFLKDDQGNAVKSRLNETLLQEIATKAGGFYLPLVGANPMEALYQKGLAPLPKTESTTKLVKNFREQFKWPLGIALLILIIEMFLPHQKRVRKTEEITKNSGLKKAVAMTAFLMLPLLCHASLSSAAKNYEAGNFPEALADYQALIAKKTNDFRLYYNAGDAAYRAQQFDTAKKHFDIALQSPDLKLQQQAYYNLGNTLFEIGEAEQDPNAKREPWENAINNYESALKLNPQDTDAKHNLAFVKKKLEELKQQQQQQDKQDQSKDDKKEDEKKDQEKKEDQNKQDQQDSAKNEDQKQDQEKQDQSKQDQKDQQQQKQDQQQQEQEKAKQEEQKQGEQQQANKPEDKEGEEQEAQAAAAGQMTLQQAMQFLEAQKQQDRTLIFAPPQDQKPRKSNIPLKDW
jgi:Ca-activated chloride channel family protein